MQNENLDITEQKKPASRMKYLQLVDYINSLIEDGTLQIGDQIPSLNQLQTQLRMSKETLLKGLNYLLEMGVIEAIYRKGYFVKKVSINHSYHVFLLLDKMNVMREQIYRSIFKSLKDVGDIDIYFHHHNYKVFEKLIKENLGNYTHYIIATFLKEDVTDVLNLIPAEKRIIIDYNQQGLSGNYSCIYQDYGYDIYCSLLQLQDRLKKYEKLILIARPEAIHAQQVIDGFLHYCVKSELPYSIESNVEEKNFRKGNAYITFSRYETDDVSLIKLAKKKGYELGKEIGLISYNDTAVKEILEGGITVISTDFEMMGKAAASVILNKNIIYKRNPTKVIIRNSL